MADEPIEYVLAPYQGDPGEMDVEGLPTVELRLTDIEGGISFVGVPEDLRNDQLLAVTKAIEDAVQAQGVQRRFVIVKGLDRLNFYRLIPKSQWDPVMQEPRPHG